LSISKDEECPITPELRELIVEILNGERKRPNNRPEKWATRERRTNMYLGVRTLESRGASTESAVAEVAQRHEVTTRSVYRAMKIWRDQFGDI
jgi:hypothetical protein